MRNSRILLPILLIPFVVAKAQAQSPCTAITDDKSRLQCYDAAAIPQKIAPSASAADPLIVKAEAEVKKLLRDPASARFTDVKISMVGSAKGVCGQLNSKNAAGGMTGPIPFTFDGQRPSVMAWDAGASNGTVWDATIIAVSIKERLDAYQKWCKPKQ